MGEVFDRLAREAAGRQLTRRQALRRLAGAMGGAVLMALTGGSGALAARRECPPGRSVPCGSGANLICCQLGTTCCGTPEKPACCPSGAVCCAGGQCCSSQAACCGTSCCGQDQLCCPDVGGQTMCCPEGVVLTTGCPSTQVLGIELGCKAVG